MTSKLTTAKYGKDGVKLLRILRNGDWHDIAEYTVTVLLQGDIYTSYTSSDNSGEFGVYVNTPPPQTNPQ